MSGIETLKYNQSRLNTYMKSYVQALNEMYEHDIQPDGHVKQADSYDSSQTAGSKIDETLREKVKEIISEGVAHMVESNCDDKSPLTYEEGYQHVMEYATNKLQELNPIDTPEI